MKEYQLRSKSCWLVGAGLAAQSQLFGRLELTLTMAFRGVVTCDGYVEDEDVRECDLEDLTQRIMSGEIKRDAILVEILEDVGSRELGSIVTGPLWPADGKSPNGRWCVTFAEPEGDGRWCLSRPRETNRYQRYVWLGGEMEVLEACAVTVSTALSAIRRCCEVGERDSSFMWLEISEGMKL